MSAAPDPAHGRRGGRVTALLPLALLESVRRHDRPREVLEDENLADSLPRRLGLTHVVESQIHRYETADRRGDPVAVEEVRNLLQLVLRRPDAETILHETGQQIARRKFGDRPAVVTAARQALPERLALIAVRRAARRLLRRLVGDGAVETGGRPVTARISGGLLAGLDETTAPVCSLYTGALEEVIAAYAPDGLALDHVRCAARGDAVCEWAIGAAPAR